MDLIQLCHSLKAKLEHESLKRFGKDVNPAADRVEAIFAEDHIIFIFKEPVETTLEIIKIPRLHVSTLDLNDLDGTVEHILHLLEGFVERHTTFKFKYKSVLDAMESA